MKYDQEPYMNIEYCNVGSEPGDRSVEEERMGIWRGKENLKKRNIWRRCNLFSSNSIKHF